MKRLWHILMYGRPAWWVYPSILLGMALVVLVAGWSLVPGPDEFCYFLGMRFGGECGFTVATGLPCPQCGMTRAFVWGARGHLVKAFFYSPGGLALFLWVQAGGVVGLVRLVARNPNRLEPPFPALAAWTGFWAICLYFLPWVGRVVFGVNALPSH